LETVQYHLGDVKESLKSFELGLVFDVLLLKVLDIVEVNGNWPLPEA